LKIDESSGFSIWASSAIRPLDLHRLGEQEQQAQKVAVVGGFHFGPETTLLKSPAILFQRIHRSADQKGGDRSAADGHHLVRQGFQDDADRAARDQEAAEHHREEDDNTADLEHQKKPE
jgi:hypothetical protein